MNSNNAQGANTVIINTKQNNYEIHTNRNSDKWCDAW